MSEVNRINSNTTSNSMPSTTSTASINATPEEVKLFDFDGNGKVDSDREIAAYANYTAARDEAKLEMKFDINGDGKLDCPEKEAFKAYITANNLDKLVAELNQKPLTNFIQKHEDILYGDVPTSILQPKTKLLPDPEPWINDPTL